MFRLNDLKLKKNLISTTTTANDQKCHKCFMNLYLENNKNYCHNCQLKILHSQQHSTPGRIHEEENNYLKLLDLTTINNKFNLKLKLNSLIHNNFKYYYIE